MKVPSLLSDTFLLLTGAQPIRSGERGRGTWSSKRRLESRVLTLCSWRSGRGGARAGGRTPVGPWRGAELRSRQDGEEGCQARRLAQGERRRPGPPWVGSAGLPRRRAAAGEAGRRGSPAPGTRACGTPCAPRFSEKLDRSQINRAPNRREVPTASLRLRVTGTDFIHLAAQVSEWIHVHGEIKKVHFSGFCAFWANLTSCLHTQREGALPPSGEGAAVDRPFAHSVG